MIKFVTLLFLLDLIVLNYANNIEQHVANSNSGNLQEDFNDFLDLIPIDDIRNLTEYFYANDELMRNSYDYLRNDGTKFAVRKLNELPMFRKFTSFLNDTGVNFADLGKRIKRIVLTDEEAKSIVVQNSDNNEEEEGGDNSGGMNSYLKEVFSILPHDEILMMFFTKMETSNAFSSLLEKFHEEDFENLNENLRKSESLQKIYFEFYLNGIDLLELGNSLKKYFWG